MTKGPKGAKEGVGTMPATSNSLGLDAKSTLYCSFCGKSQFEVRKLIAGPTVFICDECTDLCSEIVGEQPDDISTSPDGRNKILISVRIPEKFVGDEISTIPPLIREVSKAFPECDIQLVTWTPSASWDIIRLQIDAPRIYNTEDLSEEVRGLTIKLRIEQQKYLAEKSERERLEGKISGLMEDVYPLLVAKLKSAGHYPDTRIKNLCVIFIDIVGFSRMDDDERARSLDMLRSLGAVILRNEKAMYMNTWGDAIVAAFDDVSDGLRCACKFSQHFSLVGLDSRVGISWGAARISNNEIIGGDDFDGDAVNMGARIEPLADPGTVLCTEEVALIKGLENEDFYFTERNKSLSKRVGDMVVGEEIRVFEVRSKIN